VTQGMTLELLAREVAQKVIMNIVSNFRIHDRRKIECTHEGVVELPPSKGNYPQSLKADSVTGTVKLRHVTVENTILSLTFDVFHDVSIHPPVQPYVWLSIHLSTFLNTRYQHHVTDGAASI